MADTAYDADHLRQAIAAKGAIAVIPDNTSRALNIRSSLCPAPSRGMLLLKTQAIPPRRYPLRKDRPKLSGRRYSRRYRPMAPLNVHTTWGSERNFSAEAKLAPLFRNSPSEYRSHGVVPDGADKHAR
jgi:hypothetical protein